jgi:hypothetical protein
MITEHGKSGSKRFDLGSKNPFIILPQTSEASWAQSTCFVF